MLWQIDLDSPAWNSTEWLSNVTYGAARFYKDFSICKGKYKNELIAGQQTAQQIWDAD